MISVIVPIYNALPTLGHCIESILSQTYSDFELLLINDGSTDNSGSICNDYAARDERVRAIHQKNQGASLARRNGIEQSVGKYLTFVDADDFLEPECLESLYLSLTHYPSVKVAACGVSKHKKGESVMALKTVGDRLIESGEMHRRFFSYEFWGFWGKLYHRSVFDDLFFPSYTINEDYVVMVQLFHRNPQMVYVDSQLYHYIVSNTGLSHQHLNSRAMDEYYNKAWVLEFYKKNDQQYVPHAEAQLTETCIKLLRMIREAGTPQSFLKEYHEMRSFLRSHFFSILFSPYLLFGLKGMAIRYMIY